MLNWYKNTVCVYGRNEDISQISKKTEGNHFNYYNNKDVNVGIYCKKNIFSYKIKSEEIDYSKFQLKTRGDILGYSTLKNEMLNTSHHPTLSISNLSNIYSCYIPITNGEKYKLVYFDIKNNIIRVKDSLVNTVDVGNLKIGTIHINTIKDGSILESIYEDNNYTYYCFDENWTMESIANIDNSYDREILNGFLINSGCNNLLEYKIKFLERIDQKIENNEVNIKIDNVWIKENKDENLSFENKNLIEEFNKNCVKAFIEIVDKIEK